MSYTTVHDSPATASPANSRVEFASLRSGCGVFDLSTRAKISLSGNDRVRWLNGMITNKVRDLPPGQGVYAFVLNPQGHILGDLYAYNRGESLLLDTEQSQTEKLLGIFRKYIIMDKVEVTNLSDKLTAIGIAGPKVREILRAAGFELQQLEPLHFTEVNWHSLPLSVARSDNPAVESYEVWLALEQAQFVWDALTKADATPITISTLELFRIACGIPRYGQDVRERDLPQETEQLRALNFNKGCYIGQEIVERIRSRGAVHRKFTGFEVQGPLPAVGTKIQSEGKDVGEVTSAASLPLPSGERPVALGYIRRESAKQLQAGDTHLTVSDLPFAGIFQTQER